MQAQVKYLKIVPFNYSMIICITSCIKSLIKLLMTFGKIDMSCNTPKHQSFIAKLTLKKYY